MMSTPLLLRLLGFFLFLGVMYEVYTLMLASPPENRILEIDQYHGRRDFPWYKRAHRPVSPSVFNPDFAFTTEHLTTGEREALQQRMVEAARNTAKEILGDEYYRDVIPGSRLSSPDQVRELRALVDCWTRGKWVPAPNSGPIRHFQDPLYGTCDNRFYKHHDANEQREAVQYVWQPACRWAADQVEPDYWCELLDGRNMLLVGDLVHYQVHELLLDVLRDGPAVCYGELNCKDHTICSEPKTSMLRYLRNDLLSTNQKLDKAHGHPSVNIVEWPFTPGFVLNAYSIFILNRAPVVEDDATFMRQLAQTLKTLRRLKPNALVIYRSTGIGHPYCDDASGPLDAPLSDSELKRLPYGWSEQTRRNAIAREIVEAAGGLFVDLAALTDLRPDGHVGGQDCLRYCMPGPLDAWATILYNVFMGLEGQVPLLSDNIEA